MRIAAVVVLGAALMLVGCLPPSKDDGEAITGTVRAWRPKLPPHRADDLIQFCCRNSIIVGGGIAGVPYGITTGGSRSTQCLLTTAQKAEQLSCLLY